MAMPKDNLGAIRSERITVSPSSMFAISERENEKMHFSDVSFAILYVQKN